MVDAFKQLLYHNAPIYEHALPFELIALLYLHIFSPLQEALTQCQQGVAVKQEIVYIADMNVASLRAHTPAISAMVHGSQGQVRILLLISQ
jgi:hypothetical protein